VCGPNSTGSGAQMAEATDKKPGIVQRVLGRVDMFQRRHRWLALPIAVFKKFGDDNGGQLAALISYYGFFSLFPLMLALVSILGYVLSGNPHLRNQIVDSTIAQIPVLGDQLRANTGKLPGSGLGLAVGILALLWAGLGALQATESAMNHVWDIPRRDRPNFLVSKLRAVLMLVVLGIGILATTLIGAASTFRGDLGAGGTAFTIVLSLVVSTGLFFVSFKVLTHRDLGWRDIVPGAIVGAIGWVALQALGGWFVSSRIKGASQTYGTFAVVIGLLTWLYFIGQVVVLSAEVNVVVSGHRWPRHLTGDDDPYAPRDTHSDPH
jgi:YihY family inner membrane protein